ncbi:KRAB-A domain-containing protein 2-like [Penaeus monodon]|uniref:KRAB-A domain-containing protein 2-like n=1 Tax=Penaeus monodon TaxID=6687 RepID=UPI0018A6F699|nr:KRAB-A domain-containing protein 2-like [Penaeus monodon]
MKETAKKCANITWEALELFKSYCEECQMKRKRPVTQGFLQMDYGLSRPPHQILCPVSAIVETCNIMAHYLTDIFLLFGALYILQSDNGSEFIAEVICEMKIIWPKLVLIHGKPQHPRSQGSMERANVDIKDMLVAWMGDNDTMDWSIGIKFVQFQKNSSFYAGICRSPYATMFGCKAKVGLTSSSLPDEVIKRMQCEDDLLAVLTTGQNGEEPGPVPSAESAEVHFDTERPSPSVVPNTLVPVRLVSADVHVDAERGHHPSVDPNHPVPFRSQTAEVDIDAECGCHQSIVSSTQRGIGPAVGRGDPRNILGVVLERDQNDMYTIGVKAGVLKAKLSRNQFDLCPQRLLGEDSINRDRVVSLRNRYL